MGLDLNPLNRFVRAARCGGGRAGMLAMGLCLCGPMPAAAQSAFAAAPGTAPQAVSSPAVATTAPKPPDVSKEAVVFDQLQTRIRMEADGTGSRETVARIRILADAGVKAMAVLTFTYTAQNQQVDIGYVRVKKPDGTVVVTPDYNVQDMPADVSRAAPMYSDIHQKHVAVKGLGVGDTLEYEMTLRTLKPEVPGQFWLDYAFEKNLIVLDEQLDLDLPASTIATVASADAQPTVTTSGRRKLYAWTSSNLARPDPDAPPKSTKHVKPSVQVTTFTSWQQVGAWYGGLQQAPLAVTPAIQAKADALTKGLTTDEDKVRAIFNDVALHIHYIGLEFGIGRYQPHPADDVLSNEYGDCKDKHILLASLLKAEGIEAWPVLISSSRELDAATPSPAQFDHVITLVPLGGKMLWMDSTEEVAPIGSLIGVLRDKQALAIPTSKPAYLERTPIDLPYPQTARFEVEGKLSDQGMFTGHFVQTYHGDVGTLLRATFRSVPQSQWKELLQQLSNATGFGGEVKPPDVSPVEQTSQPFQISYDYTREKYGQWDDRRITPPMPPTGWELAPGLKQTKPADDVEIGSPGDQMYHTTVQIPAGWKLFPPAGIDVSEDWAEYHSSYVFKDGTYTAERHMVMKKNKVPLDQWDKYLAFRRAVYEDEERTALLVNPGQMNVTGGFIPAQNLPRGWNPDMQINAMREEMVAALQPLHDAAAIFEAAPAPGIQDVNKAKDACDEMVADAEAKSLQLLPTDIHSLSWARMLAAAWTCRGWADIEAKEAGVAEIYLRPAWRLSQNPISGYQLAHTLEVEGKKAEAAHLYELASVAEADSLVVDALPTGEDLKGQIAAGYKRVTGKELTATSLNHGQYNGSLHAELDKEEEIHQLLHSTKLTGSALYIAVFESGQPTRISLLGGDKGFESLVPTLQAHVFQPMLPNGSKARVLREVRVICSPWSGCDAYLIRPNDITSVPVKIVPTNVQDQKGTKTVQIELQPQ